MRSFNWYKVTIRHCKELKALNYNKEQFDAIALIYAQFPADIKSLYHKTIDKYLSCTSRHLDGIIISESTFSIQLIILIPLC